MDEIRIAVGIPCSDRNIRLETTASVISTIVSFRHPINFFFTNHSYIHIARRGLVLEAQKVKASHLFFVDTDMYFQGNTLEQLLSHDKDIIGVHYNQRGLPLRSTVRSKNSKDEIVVAEIKDELFECYAVGSGCMLINMKVFDTIEKPWFFYGSEEENPATEDVWFCGRAKDKGFTVWCDPTLSVKHIGEYQY